MKTKLLIPVILFAALLTSCTSNSDDTIPNNISLSQKIVYLPESTNFTNKLVSNYTNNQIVNEINYNGSGAITQTREFTYGPGTSTVSTFDPQHIFLRKTVYNYDSTNRLATIEFYNAQNQILGTRQFVYQGNDINVSYIENGVSTPIFLYKTNSSNLIYYEKSFSSGVEQTLTYSGNTPIQLNTNSGLQLGFEFFPTIMPMAIQSNATEINNSALRSTIQQIKETSNYYLKRINLIGHYTKYEKEFNVENYITHELRTNVSINPPTEQINGELFYYYN